MISQTLDKEIAALQKILLVCVQKEDKKDREVQGSAVSSNGAYAVNT